MTAPGIPVTAYTLTSALGAGLEAMRASLEADQGGLSPRPWGTSDVDTWLGQVTLPEAVQVAPRWDCRNNRLIALALAQDGFREAVAEAAERYGAHRLGLVVGTSTSSIERGELGYTRLDDAGRFAPADRQPDVHHPHAPGAFTADALGITGPCLTVSAACASSAKVFATAARWLRQNLVDAVVVGGADSLCLSVIYGFHSLQLVSPDACRPFDARRDGINLGEAAGFALLDPGRGGIDVPHLAGYGESCDAHHMSSAHPDGLGAQVAMEAAVSRAGVTFDELDYVNLHGTGTRGNDSTENLVCARLLGPRTVASATKGWTGHTLGAAGIVESVLCLNALETGLVPGTLNTDTPEADFNLALDTARRQPRLALSNSFGFGGNNCALVFARS